MKRLAILGAGGHGKVIADIALASGVVDIIYYDDRFPKVRASYNFPVVGCIEDAVNNPSDYDEVIVAIGEAKVRAKLHQRLSKLAPACIHPSAIISQSVRFGKGSVVMPGTVINADVRIGEGAIINSGAVVEHDCLIGDFSHICPNSSVAGNVVVGNYSWLGIGCSVLQQINIGSHVTIGAGALVIKDIPDNKTAVGVPAKLIERR